MTGRRPKRSDSEPSTGAAKNCIAAHDVPNQPTVRAESAMSPRRNVLINSGSTGMIIPSASMSSMTVMKMKATAARRGPVESGEDIRSESITVPACSLSRRTLWRRLLST
jgi:hypothetical protein